MHSPLRAGLAAIAALALMGSALAAAGTANAMGSGNPYEDLQVGVTYTVYQPQFTGGQKLTHTGTEWSCPEGTEQNMFAQYGGRWKGGFTVNEGKPICSDPGGPGFDAGTVKVQGVPAHLQVYCDPSIAAQWKACSRADMAKYGGALSFTLPGQGNLRSTDIVLETLGKKPLSAKKLITVARSMLAIASQPIGGMVTCTQADFGDVIAAGLPKGEVLVSVDSFACDSGWAYAFATLGDGKGHNIVVTDVFEAEGQFWIPKDRAKVCGTVEVNHPGVRPADSLVPAGIWSNACNTN